MVNFSFQINPMLYFKIGSYILILTCFLHLFGHFQKAVPENETEEQLLSLMINYKMDVGFGQILTMMELQKGFSLCFSLLFLWSGVLGLFLSRQLSSQPMLLKRISKLYASALLIGTVISMMYFFLAPTLCFALALISFSIASIRIQ